MKGETLKWRGSAWSTMRSVLVQFMLIAGFLLALDVAHSDEHTGQTGPGGDQAIRIEPKNQWMRDALLRGESKGLQDKMLAYEFEEYANLRALLEEPRSAEVWTIGEPTDSFVQEEDRREPGHTMQLRQSGLRATEAELAQIAAVAPIEMRSELRPMAIVTITEKRQFDELGALPFVYLIDVYPAGDIVFHGLREIPLGDDAPAA